jgi:flagellin-like hook-associated protein FlgL
MITQMADLSSRQTKLQEQVSTGQKVRLPGDDPAAVGRLLMLEAERRRVNQFERNTDVALELSQATYAQLKSMKDLSDRTGELALLSTGSLGVEATTAYAAEVDQLIEQAVQVANGKLRDDYLFAGTAVDSEPFNVTRDANGKIASAAYVGDIGTSGAGEMRIQVSKSQLLSRGDEIERLVSSEADADLPGTIVKLSQASTAYEAALASASRILNLSILDYLR